MVTGRRANRQQIASVGRGALALLLGLALISLAVTAGRSHAASSPTPALVSRVSSMIGTADGTLLEGGDPAPPAPARPPSAPLAGLRLLAASGAALAGLALIGAALYRRYTPHVT